MKALAYDPDTVDHIYAGGDVCGVYESYDNGVSWTPINKGLETPDNSLSYYVDDLIVIGEGDPENPVPISRRGVYAATHGGIFFRVTGADYWVLQTDYHANSIYWYSGNTNSYAGPKGAPVPFSCFGYDKRNRVLYAGAGHGERDRANGEPWRNYYPEAPGAGNQQFALWALSLDSTPTSWTAVAGSEQNIGIMRQFAILDIVGETETESLVVFSSRNGVFTYDPSSGLCENILIEYGKRDIPGVLWSGKAWGVAAGASGRLYSILTEGLEDDGETDFSPGVWYVDMNDEREEREFVLLQPDSPVPPHSGTTWIDILTFDGADLYSLTVIPGIDSSHDQVFVGTSGTTYGGLCRYGSYINQLGMPATGWMHIICLDPPTWDEFGYKYLNYLETPYFGVHSFEPGWLTNGALYSTVPMVYHPLNVNHMFNMSYHIPMAMDDVLGAGKWQQRNCSGSGDYWSSTGLNLMCPRATDFLSNGRLVIGAGDFETFVASDALGTSFEWLDHYAIGSKDVNDIEVVNDDIYVVRGAPRKDIYDPFQVFCFGFSTYIADGETYPRPRQETVIARYNENLCNVYYPNNDSYCWEYLSRGLDAAIASGRYGVSCFEIVHDDTMFAAVKHIEPLGGWTKIFKAIRTGGVWTWDTTPWWSGPADDSYFYGGIPDMLYIPRTKKLAVVINNSGPVPVTLAPGGGVWVVDMYQRNTASAWLAMSGEDSEWSHKQRMVKFAQKLACDENGEYLYVSSQGGIAYNETHVYVGGVMRLEVPRGVAPQEVDWVVIMNGENSPYTDFAMPYGYYPGWGSTAEEITYRMTNVRSIDIDPVNPLHVYAGLGVGLHPNNGVWEYVPGEWGWVQRTGDTMEEPSFGVVTLDISPVSSSTMFIGTAGAEYFRFGITASTVPTVTLVEPLHEEQTLLMVEGVAADGSGPLESVVIDGTPLGLPAGLELNDSGVSGDWEGGDGIWTKQLNQVNATPGNYSLPIVARDELGYTLRGTLEVEVIATPEVFYRNVSPEVVFTYDGTPAGVTPVDLYVDQFGIDNRRDIFMSKVGTGADGTLLLHPNSNGPVPQYIVAEIERFGYQNVPGEGNGPATAADLDNDGLQDLIIPAGVGNGGLRFYKQQADGDYELQSGWNPLTSAQQENTWFAACADYDGDGYLDVYLCRATAGANGLPGSGSSAVPDILLRNSLYRTGGSFVNATDEIDFVEDLATGAAAWCDYDADGDIDLAIADCATGGGIQIYENDAGRFDARFERVYRSDSAWTAAVSDIAWIGNGQASAGDAGLDLLVTTYSEQDGPVLCTYENEAFSWGLALSASQTASASGVRVLDLDHDGDLDFALLPLEDDEVPRFVIYDNNTFAIGATVPGMTILNGASNGALLADLTGDGAQDLFLGRPQVTNRFLTTASAPSQNWAGLRLLDDSRGYAPAFGARVVFPTKDIAMTVDCNGRSDQALYIGLVGETETCTIYWPSGHVENATLNSGEVATKLHQATFANDFLFVGTPGCATELHPQGLIDFIYSWRTTTQSDILEDTVTSCGIEFKEGDANVHVQQWFEWYNEAPVYHHELRLNNVQCVVGTTTFTVRSKRGTVSLTSDETTVRVRVCTSDLDPDD
ncbi:MAG TPA: VCBS repeat-containing protein [Candidatus Krumholzibacteria bacterium]|nr:VCBS repeat-containing protein [Candidatus Krumholzibacteria bacterium]HPD73304.1 VCBS repeat-containing protein [Candidatus Krumholzibacteria bacterium]HRY42020.1 VCBS repeat-containing protein [Candidatus Krumholzibacteria bacterium]